MKDRERRNKTNNVIISNERDNNDTCNACGWMDGWMDKYINNK